MCAEASGISTNVSVKSRFGTKLRIEKVGRNRVKVVVSSFNQLSVGEKLVKLRGKEYISRTDTR